MKKILFLLAWLFILLAAAFDGYFAWCYRADFGDWEINPLARWFYHNLGIEMLLGLKGLVMTFACSVAFYCHCRRHPMEKPITLIVVSCYLLLSLHYLAAYASAVSLSSSDALAFFTP